MGDKNGNNRGKGNPNGFGGKYVRKAENLTAKQLRAAGGKKAAAKRTVSISDTKRAYGTGKTLGPGGKPLTGSVRLENGSMAVYKDGKRVTVAPKAKAAAKPSSGRSTSSTSSRTPSRTTTVTTTVTKPKDKGPKDKGAKPASSTARMGRTYTTTTQTNPQASSASASAARRAAADRAARASGQVPSASRSYANGSSASPSRAQRGADLGLNPATGGTRANPSPYVNSASQNQRNAGKPPASRAGGSKNKRGGERRTPEGQARDATRRAVKNLSR